MQGMRHTSGHMCRETSSEVSLRKTYPEHASIVPWDGVLGLSKKGRGERAVKHQNSSASASWGQM